jgi:hypothetical protein
MFVFFFTAFRNMIHKHAVRQFVNLNYDTSCVIIFALGGDGMARGSGGGGGGGGAASVSSYVSGPDRYEDGYQNGPPGSYSEQYGDRYQSDRSVGVLIMALLHNEVCICRLSNVAESDHSRYSVLFN